MTEQQRQWIEGAPYEELLKRWRFGRAGDPIFLGDTGDYFFKVMARKRKEAGNEEHTRISKKLGWGPREL